MKKFKLITFILLLLTITINAQETTKLKIKAVLVLNNKNEVAFTKEFSNGYSYFNNDKFSFYENGSHIFTYEIHKIEQDNAKNIMYCDGLYITEDYCVDCMLMMDIYENYHRLHFIFKTGSPIIYILYPPFN